MVREARHGEPVVVLAGELPAAGPFVALGDRLRVPRQRVDAELSGHLPGDLAVRQVGCAPLVEQVEPLLPAAAGALADPVVGRREPRGAAVLGRCAAASRTARAAV